MRATVASLAELPAERLAAVRGAAVEISKPVAQLGAEGNSWRLAEAVTRMGGREPVVRAESLSKRYGRILALDGLSLDVRAGEVLGFLGPNGAGKTTMLRLLMGYLRPTAGSARVHGLDSWRDSVAVHAHTGYLPGDLRLWPRLSARMIAGHLARLRGLNHDPGTAGLAKRRMWIWTGRSASCPRATGRRWGCCWRCWATPSCCCWMSRPAGWMRWSSRNSTWCCGNPSRRGRR